MIIDRSRVSLQIFYRIVNLFSGFRPCNVLFWMERAVCIQFNNTIGKSTLNSAGIFDLQLILIRDLHNNRFDQWQLPVCLHRQNQLGRERFPCHLGIGIQVLIERNPVSSGSNQRICIPGVIIGF